jgi:hypothetical protein
VGKKRNKPDDKVEKCNSCRQEFRVGDLHVFHATLDKHVSWYYVCDVCVRPLAKILGLPEDWNDE